MTSEPITALSLQGLSAREIMACGLRSTDDHLFLDGGRIIVCGPDADGNLRLMGSVDPYASLQVNAPSLRQMIDRVRFSHSTPSPKEP